MTDSSTSSIARLIDIEDIRRLKYQYAALCDENYNPEKLADLFTSDAIWDGGIFGIQTGQAAIRDFFASSEKLVEYAIHYVGNPIIDVNGDTAKGSWYLWQRLVVREKRQAYWLIAKYSDDYVRVDGRWKFAHVRLIVESFTRYEDGPGKVRISTDLS
jgi:hypothetical protein